MDDPALSPTEVQEGKFFAVISYISFFCIVSLVLKKENKFSLYHARQGLVLFVFEVLCFILSVIPVFWLIRAFIFLFFFLVSLLGILHSLQGRCIRIPVLSEIAQKVIV
jgi:uncharacterized membrane protein